MAADSENAALHIEGLCEVFDGSGLVQFDYVPFKSVENNNTFNVVCRGTVDPAPARTLHYDQVDNPTGSVQQYAICANGESSTSWHQTITPDGRTTVKITCPTSRV